MKTLSAFLTIFCIFASQLPAQTDSLHPAADSLPTSSEEQTFEMFDITQHPSYPGGNKAMLQFLASNIVYPDSAHAKNIQGTVAATFVVDKDGSVTNASIVRDIGDGCGEEVLRVLALMPKWTPGEVDGKPVKVRFTLPVRFRLTDDKPKKN